MLASTVQFSNNDQPPVTTHRSRFSPGPALKAAIRPYPQTPNSVPGTLAAPLNVPHPCGQYWKNEDGQRVPNNQRSTHEQPAPDVRRCTGL
jgi:hypothetical protein